MAFDATAIKISGRKYAQLSYRKYNVIMVKVITHNHNIVIVKP